MLRDINAAEGAFADRDHPVVVMTSAALEMGYVVWTRYFDEFVSLLGFTVGTIGLLIRG